jgi:hypothetical protein
MKGEVHGDSPKHHSDREEAHHSIGGAFRIVVVSNHAKNGADNHDDEQRENLYHTLMIEGLTQFHN